MCLLDREESCYILYILSLPLTWLEYQGISMPISPVELELWRIFTYYTLHSDPTQPEHLRVLILCLNSTWCLFRNEGCPFHEVCERLSDCISKSDGCWHSNHDDSRGWLLDSYIVCLSFLWCPGQKQTPRKWRWWFRRIYYLSRFY